MSSSFDWSDFFSIAKSLSENSDKLSSCKEAWLRTSTSRAYYATYGLCMNKAIQENAYVKKKDSDDHYNLIKTYRENTSDSVSYKISNLLNKLRIKRNKADYDATIIDIKKETNLAIHYAKELIKELERVNFKII